MKKFFLFYCFIAAIIFAACEKSGSDSSSNPSNPNPTPAPLKFTSTFGPPPSDNVCLGDDYAYYLTDTDPQNVILTNIIVPRDIYTLKVIMDSKIYYTLDPKWYKKTIIVHFRCTMWKDGGDTGGMTFEKTLIADSVNNIVIPIPPR